MQELLKKGGLVGAACIAAVTTRAAGRSAQLDKLANALREYKVKELCYSHAGKYMEDEDDTDSSDKESADDSEREVAQAGAKGAEGHCAGTIALSTPEEKARALEECHYSLIAGHFSARKTQEKL
jgi:hypothetical protein